MAMRNIRNKNHPPNTDLVQNYFESTWDIVTDLYKSLPLLEEIGEALQSGTLDDFLSAADIDTLAKINGIFTDFQVGRFSTQGEAEGGTDNITTMTPLRVAQAIAALAIPYDNNLTGDGPPTANDDNTLGYGVNSIWMDITADPDETYRCTDASTGAALWIKTSLTADELATVAISGNSDDLIQGTVQLLMTVAERTKLGNVPETGAEIAALLFAESDTNNFDDTYKDKLDNIEADATADQTDSEIVTGYNNLVGQVSPAEKSAGSETAIRRYSPLDIREMAENFSGGLVPEFKNADFIAEYGKRYYVDTTGGPVEATLPVGVNLGYMGFADCSHYFGTNALTITPNGAETVDGVGALILDQDENDVEITYDSSNTNWKATVDGTPQVMGLDDLLFDYLGKTIITGAYTLLETDKGKLLIANSATDVNLTVPSNASIPFADTSRFDMINRGAGTITVVVTTDTLVSTANKCVSGASITLTKIDTTEWWITGGSA